jgi:hypothetical protein
MSNPFDANDTSRRAEHLSPDQILDLAQGLLDRGEADAATAHLHECRACSDALRECATRVESIAAGPQPIVLPDGVIVLEERGLSSAMGQPRRFHRIRSLGRRRAALGAALSTAAVATLLVFVFQNPSDTLVAEPYWIPVEARAATRGPDIDVGPSNATPSDFDAALEAYARQNLPRAIERLEIVRPPDDVEPLRRLYLASAYVLDGRSGQAIETLDRLDIESLPQPWRSRARWTLYLAMRDAGSGARAHRLLEELTAEEGQIGDLARQEQARLY